MRSYCFTAFLIYICSFSIYAQRIEKVVALYTYYPPSNISLDQAKEIALQRAKIQAIAERFGTIISESNSTIVKNVEGNSSVDFFLLGNSEVKGEWLETIGEPQIKICYENDMLAVQVSIKGKIREIVTAPIDIVAKILRNGTEDRFEDSNFNVGDDLYMSVCSPVDGFLAVYLVDDENKAFCILPYKGQANGAYNIKANQRYVLFSEQNPNSSELSFLIDEYSLTANKELERNQIYVIFSTHPFVKAVDAQVSELLPRELDNNSFQKWLSSCRTFDNDMRVHKTIITINNFNK